jgi:cytochrome b561
MRRYTAPAIVLHWLIALALAGNLIVGFWMADLALSPLKLKVYSWHKWSGVTIFLLVVLRVLWRLAHRPPAMPASMPRWQITASHVSHAVLYLLTLAVPLTGWLYSSARGFQTVWFGVLPIPDLLAKDALLADLLHDAHENLNLLMAALVIVHVAAALKHHFVDRDDVLRSMLPHGRA